MKPGCGIIDGFLVQPHNFYQADPHFGARLISYVAILAKIDTGYTQVFPIVPRLYKY